jgi:flagellar biosynthesis anti-sigma factor FlgM
MRIDENSLSGINSAATAASQKVRTEELERSTAVKAGTSSASQDEVRLSSLADRVSAGKLSTDQTVSPERAARIEQLTKLVQSGQYNPSPEKVASAMIRDMLSGAVSS